MARRGRPLTYEPEFAGQAQKLCQLGATDIEIADFFGVHVATLNRWKAEFPEFCASIKSGKAEADERVERSLFHRANGYSFDSEKVFQFQGEIVRAKTREHVPPDTTACIFWLKNRRPDDWRDKSEHVIRDESSALTDEELHRIAAAGGIGALEAPRNPSKLN